MITCLPFAYKSPPTWRKDFRRWAKALLSFLYTTSTPFLEWDWAHCKASVRFSLARDTSWATHFFQKSGLWNAWKPWQLINCPICTCKWHFSIRHRVAGFHWHKDCRKETFPLHGVRSLVTPRNLHTAVNPFDQLPGSSALWLRGLHGTVGSE